MTLGRVAGKDHGWWIGRHHENLSLPELAVDFWLSTKARPRGQIPCLMADRYRTRGKAGRTAERSWLADGLLEGNRDAKSDMSPKTEHGREGTHCFQALDPGRAYPAALSAFAPDFVF